MELKLKGYGTIEITNATLVDGGDILIETADYFKRLAETTDYEITEVYLVESEFGWNLVAWLDVPDDDWFTDKAIVIETKNNDDIYRLNAVL